MSGSNSIYSPLPQSNSESDEFSEEELHTFNQRLGVINRLGNQENQLRPKIILNSKSPDVISYNQWNGERQLGIALTSFQMGNDEVPPFTTHKSANNLSPARKVCLTFSIFVCVFTIVFFVWILPCETDSCPNAAVTSVKKPLSHIELFGPITIVSGIAGDKVGKLIFLFRKSFTGENGGIINGKLSGGNGVVSVLADSKESSWLISLEKEPTDVDCNVVDVNLDGMNDCLIVGKDNLLMAIESVSGKKLWEFNGDLTFNWKNCNFEFPLVLPDIDGDRVKELLSICAGDSAVGDVKPYSQTYFFILISGRRGSVMGKPAEIRNCYSIFNITLESEYVISYRCLNWTKRESVNTLSFRNFFFNVNGSTLEKLNLEKSNSHIFQHKSNAAGNVVFLDGRRMRLDNKGQCPGECSMSVTIKDERNMKINDTVWALTIQNSYGMIPVGLTCEKFTGFVFKYWHWEAEEKAGVELGSSRSNARNDDGERERSDQKSRSLEMSKSLEYAMFGGDMPISARVKRTLTKKSTNAVRNVEWNVFNKENLTFHRIIERIVLITFNETNMHVINTSQCEIVQICVNRGNCQPDSHFQRQSLHIEDVNNDNFQELISYSSSFINQLDQESSLEDGVWQLQSNVEVINLESELAKVYEAKN